VVRSRPRSSGDLVSDGPGLPSRLATIVLTFPLWLAAGTIAFAAERSTSQFGPIRLSDTQMAHVIAGGRVGANYMSPSGSTAMAPPTAAPPSANATALRERISSPTSAHALDPAQMNSAKRSAISRVLPRLSESQLDHITAGATLDLNLTASAQGPVVIASTAGEILSGETTVLQLDLSPGAPAHLIGSNPSTVIIAIGAALARGADGAQCSANVEATGFFSTLNVTSQTSGLPPSGALPAGVLCACSAFAITPIAH
jgi:hypothetical protein